MQSVWAGFVGRVALRRVKAPDNGAIANQRSNCCGAGEEVSSGNSGPLMFHRYLLFGLLQNSGGASKVKGDCSIWGGGGYFAVVVVPQS